MTDSEKLDLILSEMQGVKTGMQSMETRMQGIESRMQTMENDLHEVKQKVTNIDLTLENEIRVNIKRVAEWNFEMSRKLYEVLRTNSEQELITIRVNILESELRRLKERLDQIA